MVNWIVRKRVENGKIWDFRGSFVVAKRPLAATKRPLAATKDPHAAARLRGKVGPASGYCSQHRNVVFLFRFVFPLFRRLVYWTSKDSISV